MESPAVGDDALSQASEAYLRAVCELQELFGKATTSAVAEQLQVSDPSAARMVKKLARLGLVNHTPYHGAELTPAGEVLARRAIHRRDLIARYLIRFLGYSPGEAGAEAGRLEHATSETFERRIDALLRGPASDRHDDSVHAADI
jgi:DtxR family Mn-dependent transcriptional regulator